MKVCTMLRLVRSFFFLPIFCCVFFQQDCIGEETGTDEQSKVKIHIGELQHDIKVHLEKIQEEKEAELEVLDQLEHINRKVT
ncbi:MAG: hypothetical protein D3916_03605, partial [Candidatus Electrothrix sp. MAN1_4]|nr:hypothetical protein [Candidatus Electrothrix sp. MAN1_4]